MGEVGLRIVLGNSLYSNQDKLLLCVLMKALAVCDMKLIK